jgi:hypothetical protein
MSVVLPLSAVTGSRDASLRRSFLASEPTLLDPSA